MTSNIIDELQPVVLAAGKGSRMPELTANKPKCLLPIGGKPMVWYPLFQLQKSGFPNAILVVCENHQADIETELEKTGLKISIDYFTIPPDDDLGTADSLRLLHEKVKSDVIILPCDIVTDVNLNPLIHFWRKTDPSACVLLLQPQEIDKTLSVPGPKTKYKPEKDIFGVDIETNRIVFIESTSNFIDEEMIVKMPKCILNRHRIQKICYNEVDPHVYVLKKWVVDYLQNDENIATIRGELLPYLVKKQFFRENKSVFIRHAVNGKPEGGDLFNCVNESRYKPLMRDLSSYLDHTGDLEPTYHRDAVRCYVLIDSNDAYGIRANTMHNYWSANRNVTARWSKLTGNLDLVKIDPTADNRSTQVDDKCIIWDGVKLHERTSFKDSVVGSGSEVNKFSRVLNSVIMNNVIVKEKVAIENCIICDGAVIETGSKLRGCIVGSNHTVEENSEIVNEVLTESDPLKLEVEI